MAAQKQQPIDEVDNKEIIKQIELQMTKLGDLPIFSASLNKIRRVSKDEDSDAMSLAMEVMKDANLVTKLLQLANSSYYNRGYGKIASVSRSVILLGFETISSLCLTLKLIDSFNSEHPSVDMNLMLVNAFLTAAMAREVAEKAGIKDVEESYICGLLHGLGEIIVAYALPEKYDNMLRQSRETDNGWGKIQQQELGGSFYLIGRKLAEQWGFGNSVVKTMSPYKKTSDKTLRDVAGINNALASLSHESLDVIYARSNRSKQSLGDLYQDLADAVGVERTEIEESMQKTFRTSCELAKDYGLDVKLLMPPVKESDDALLNKTARQLAFFAGTRAKQNNMSEDGNLTDKQIEEDSTGNESSASEVENKNGVETQAVKPEEPNVNETASGHKKPTKVKNQKPQADLQAQLSILQEITGLITSAAGVHHVFGKVLDGLHRGIGFKRVVLCLLNTDHTELQMRLGVGDSLDALKGYFNIQARDRKNIFVKVLREGNKLYVSDVNDVAWKGSVSDSFIKEVAVSSFIISALRSGNKPVGLFYADNGSASGPINETMQQGFVQFVSQAKLALQYAEMQRGK